MTWQQVKPFSRTKAGKVKNMCLANVRAGYGVTNLLPDAWTAWKNTQQHTGTPPAGVDVPVFFSYIATIDGQNKNWGHIGVRLKDGKFWSDGVTYENITAYTATHSPKYVGWGESVNNERVIKQEDDMYKGKSAKQHHEEARTWKSKTMALRKENASLKAELGKADEANLLGRALIKLIAQFGYKKGK